MTLNLSMPDQDELKPRITVFGVGGAGGNAVNNMIENQLEGADFVVANTDAQALQQSQAGARVQLGVKVTEGLGAGAKASVGAAAAEESIEQIVDHLAGAHMCFITAGMGGGTGTGAAPIIAQAARELGVLTVGVVTKPFQFEGAKRMRQAEAGVEALQKVVDTLIIIPNQNLFRLANEKTTFTEAFRMADDVLYQGVKGVTDLMVRPGLINLDFADVRAVMDEMGKAMMGTGEAEGEERAVQAAEKAIANPLLDEISLRGARGVLINITGSSDLTLFELDEAANRVREEVDPEANIIVGSTLDESMGSRMRVSVVATGIDASQTHQDAPMPRRNTQAVSESAVQPEPQKPTLQLHQVQATQPRQAQPQQVQPQQAAPLQVEQYEEDEPSLFEPQQAQVQTPASGRAPVMNDMFAQQAEEAALPEPAYQPRRNTQPETIEADPSAFVAPRAPAPGTPSPELLARVQAAAERNRESDAHQETEKARFGINSLIGRMTGQTQEQPPLVARRSPQMQAPAPQAPAPQADYRSSEEEKIAVPAFLRRQAN